MLKFPEKFRIAGLYGESGAFKAEFESRELRIIASNEIGWDHVSVSLNGRCPNWREMCFVKELFWNEEDCVIQFHPPKTAYVNFHPFCLHLWRPHEDNIPLPPSFMI